MTEERMQVLGTQIVSALRRRSDLMSVRGDPARLAREVARWILEDLRIEDEITQEAVNRVAGYGRGIPPGTSEWQILVDKHKDEIAARRGYVLG
ncbi:MAG TPA: DUF507 family protein [Candidatus Eisenbacteria bacterium]|nr:DUF507 family protein [Candidatus Eisenbacteria bacterium]